MRRRTLSAVLAAVLLLSACGSSAGDATEAVPSPSSTQSADAAASPEGAETVMVPTADGGELDFNTLRGQDVMLWFWAPW